MDVPKIYLETTMFNYYFDRDRDFHPDTVALFEQCAAGKFVPYTSTYALDELEAAPIEKYSKMIELIDRYKINVLPTSDEAISLANHYISENALPKSSFIDARHIATATIAGLNMIVSLNFKHIVREKTITLTGAINLLNGYQPIKIKSPQEVIDYEET
ncbi:MAG: hypothetical protein LBN97_05175 [Oscillospiraceae bacterium]|jgi:predicted nucleic acid-binding protein|nr:hypothetical protein [Oscillospiraceae bacterium]